MIVTSTPSVEGKSIAQCLGIVNGSSIEFTSHSLGSFSAYKVGDDANTAANDAVSNMQRNAPRGTDAIVGVNVKTSLTYIGDGAGDLACLATATGTAVKLENQSTADAEDSYVLPEL